MAQARERQAQHFAATSGRIRTSADMGTAEVREHCTLDAAGQSLMRAAMRQLQISAHAYHRVLKLSRTIADRAGSDAISPRTWPRHCSTDRGGRNDRPLTEQTTVLQVSAVSGAVMLLEPSW